MQFENSDLFAELSPYIYQKLKYYKSSDIALMPGSTVCAAMSTNGKIYCEVSRVSQMNGTVNVSHSERDVLELMRQSNDPIPQYMLLMDTNGAPIIPCPGCIQFITSINPQVMIVLPNDTHLMSLHASAMPNPMPMNNQPMMSAQNTASSARNPNPTFGVPPRPAASTMSVKAQEDSASSTLIRNKLSALKNEINQPVEPEEVEKKKKFFGLF